MTECLHWQAGAALLLARPAVPGRAAEIIGQLLDAGGHHDLADVGVDARSWRP